MFNVFIGTHQGKRQTINLKTIAFYKGRYVVENYGRARELDVIFLLHEAGLFT